MTRFEHDLPAHASADEVVVEEPLEIRVAGDSLAITMRTPGHDQELAAGFLLAEGVIEGRHQLGGVAHCGKPGDEGWGNVIDVLPAPGSVFDVERTRRGILTSAACGVCGRRSVDDLLSRAPPLDDPVRVGRSVLAGLAETLRGEQKNFQRTGGLHAAALADADGRLLIVREDVGRHNAVDKLFGRLLLDNALPASGRILLVSGRTSFEIVQKAVVARAPIVVAVSAPSSLAIATARNAGLTLVGFARHGSFNVYAGAERVLG